jgi:hypothetical protein
VRRILLRCARLHAACARTHMTPTLPPAPARRAWLGLLALVVLAALAAWSWLARAPQPEPSAPQPSPSQAAPLAATGEPEAELAPPTSAPADAEEQSAWAEFDARESLEAEAASRDAGALSVLVHALTPDGSPWAGSWTLRVEDAREGAVRGWRPRSAGTRELALEQDSALVEGLLPGRWSFAASAGDELAGHASERSALLLELPAAAQAQPAPYGIELVLYPCSPVDGRVLDEQGGVLEGVELALDFERDGSRRWARTDAQGWYAFALALPGEYRLSVGHPENPSLPPRRVEFAGEAQMLEPVVLARASELSVRVLEPDGMPASGVKLRARGSAGGWIEGETDALGHLLARHLPAGRYRVFAERDAQRRANRVIELAAGASAELEIQLP